MSRPHTFLLKTEPGTYAYADLARDGKTAWDGVRNHQAAAVLKRMAPGDEAFIYHSVSDKAIVGVARVLGAARPDPTDPSGKFVCVDLEAVRPLRRPVGLAELKAAGFGDFALVRQSRLSCMAVPEEVRAWILEAEAR